MIEKPVAFIPARSGSKRVPHKNVKIVRGHPLLAYSIRAAIDSGVFDAVICATDNEYYARIARYYGAEVPFLRPPEISCDKSPDVEWVKWLLQELAKSGRSYSTFSILRPTNPLRRAETIRQAFDRFRAHASVDSLRAVEMCVQHPGKMWVIHCERMVPLLPFSIGSTPWHSSQYAALPEVYVQNASLEIAWSRVPLELGTIAGSTIVPFISQGLEGFDINEASDWVLLEHYLGTGEASLPPIDRLPYSGESLREE